MSRLRRNLYRGAALLGDVQAAERGPDELARRLIRRRMYAHTNRLTRSLLRAVGLSR